MKKLLLLAAMTLGLCAGDVAAQAKKRPSPADTVVAKIATGTTVMIAYSQPSLKGRTIGKDVEPMNGKLWRVGANEATTFEVDKPVTIDGKKLPGGKYALFMMPGENEYTLIFNHVWQTWGAYDYEKNKGEDELQVKVKPLKSESSQEQLKFSIDPSSGKVTLRWGNLVIPFTVK